MSLKIATTKQGDNTNYPKRGDKLKMHYTGVLSNGEKFDSSRDRGEPFEFIIGVGQVIDGWDEGIIKMSKGQRGDLYIGAIWVMVPRELVESFLQMLI